MRAQEQDAEASEASSGPEGRRAAMTGGVSGGSPRMGNLADVGVRPSP
jgi:hypothetical protein